MQIVNLTPHPVIIIRRCPDPHGPPEAILETRHEFPPCVPADLPRAVESSVESWMLIDETGDGQAGIANGVSMDRTGLVDLVGYTGVDGLPDLTPDERAFGVRTFRIVSIVTALGALAAGRPIVDLLVPMGQVRDERGRIVGATGLAPATRLLTPVCRRFYERGRAAVVAGASTPQLIAELRVRLEREIPTAEERAEIALLVPSKV